MRRFPSPSPRSVDEIARAAGDETKSTREEPERGDETTTSGPVRISQWSNDVDVQRSFQGKYSNSQAELRSLAPHVG